MLSLKLKQKVRNSLFLLFICSPVWGKLNQTYPLSPVTTLRAEAYQDAFQTIYGSTGDINISSWDVTNGTYSYVSSTFPVSGWTAVFSSFTFNVDGSTTANWDIEPFELSIQDYTKSIQNEQRSRDINQILDDDVEEYMVWPDTNPVLDWKGWCSQIINGNRVPVTCP